MTTDGQLVERFVYDPWGKVARGDADVFIIDSLAAYPWGQSGFWSKIVGSHGYTGHEHIVGCGLINANARVYDPFLGRFLSPDPLIQDPASTQNFNRYAYCLNNPLKYTDEDGEYWNIIIGALIGGVGNVWSNWSAIKQNGFWSGLGYFVSGVTQAAGVWAGALVGAGTGALTGAATNSLTTIGNNIISGSKWDSGLKSAAINGALMGAVSGAISGGVQGYKYAKAHGADPLNRNYIDLSDEGAFYDHKAETYTATSEKTITLQPDKSRHCYGYVDEYADQGHFNHKAEQFIDAVRGVDGIDPTVPYNKVCGTSGSMHKVSGNQWKSLGRLLSNNAEIMSTTNNHAVNVRAITIGYKLRLFGGGIGNQPYLFSAYVHDPLIGYTNYPYLDCVGIIHY